MTSNSQTEFPIKPMKCVARRHIHSASFKTYDAMLAVALRGAQDRKEKGEWKLGDPLLFYGKATRLANMNDRNESVERDAMAKLERDGWIVCTHEEQRRRKRAGTFTTSEYRVLTHDEFVASHLDSCPALRYDDNGKPIKAGSLPRPLFKEIVRAHLQRHGITYEGAWAETLLDMVVDQPRPTNAGKLAQVTNAEIPATVIPAAAEIPATVTVTNAEIPATTAAGIPATTAAEIPATMFVLDAPFKSPPSILPACTESEREDGREEGFCNQEDQEPEPTAEETAELEKSWEDFNWTSMLRKIPEQMRGAVPTKEQREQVIELLTGKHHLDEDFFLAAMKSWIDEREMPIEDRRFNKWGAWLAECEPFIEVQYKEQSKAKLAMRTQAVYRQILRLHPDAFIVGEWHLDGWVVIRRCKQSAPAWVGIYPSEARARERAGVACVGTAAACNIQQHVVRSLHSIWLEWQKLEAVTRLEP